MKIFVLILLMSAAGFCQEPGKVVFYQASQIHQGGNGYRGGVHVSINIDGKQVHKLKNFKFWQVNLPAGDHFITSDIADWGKTYSIRSGESYFFRLENMGPKTWHSATIKFRAVAVPENVAEGELTGLAQDSD